MRQNLGKIGKVFCAGSLLALGLTGCSVEEIAATAADAAACKALTSTLDGLSNAYQEGLIDSGVLSQVDDLVGDQVDSLLSTNLAQDLSGLLESLAQSESASGAQESVDGFLDSIRERCAQVGVEISG